MRFIGEMQGIYLGSYKAYHPNYNIIYQDINGKRDLGGDMMDVDLSEYDYVIATPPCNFWSRANWNPSQYSFDTQHLLPDILKKLVEFNKPFIVENVRNDNKFRQYGLFDYKHVYVYRIGRHTYWSSFQFNTYINQIEENIQYLNSKDRQGSYNVHMVIEKWLKTFHTQNQLE